MNEHPAVNTIQVRLPAPLRSLSGNCTYVDVEANSLAGMIDALEARFPGMKAQLCESGGTFRRCLRFVINDEDLCLREKNEDELHPGDEVTILSAIACG